MALSFVDQYLARNNIEAPKVNIEVKDNNKKTVPKTDDIKPQVKQPVVKNIKNENIVNNIEPKKENNSANLNNVINEKVVSSNNVKTTKSEVKNDDISNTIANKVEEENKKIEDLFKRSECNPSKKEFWIAVYKKAQGKKGYVQEKCARGRFIINDQNNIELLSDYDTSGKSVAQLLEELSGR